MSAAREIFLDIETDWERNLTVVGFLSDVIGVRYSPLSRPEISEIKVDR